MARTKGPSTDRQLQIAIERGLVPADTVLSKGVVRAKAISQVVRSSWARPEPAPTMPVRLPDTACPHCGGRGCGERATRHDDQWCVLGRSLTWPEVLGLKRAAIHYSEEEFRQRILPRLMALHAQMGLDLVALHVR